MTVKIGDIVVRKKSHGVLWPFDDNPRKVTEVSFMGDVKVEGHNAWWSLMSFDIIPERPTSKELEAVIRECEERLAAAKKALDEFNNPPIVVGTRFQKGGDSFRIVYIHGQYASYVNERTEFLFAGTLSLWKQHGYARVS